MHMHDVIKIRLSNMGYLPGYPYHLISDNEMIKAFIGSEGFFNDFYPCPSDDLEDAYELLKNTIEVKLSEYIISNGDKPIPNWIYSYMLMRPITYQSDEAAIDYLSGMLNLNSTNALPEFDADMARACYQVSCKWLTKFASKALDEQRPPTMFGETHVTKSLRLDQANVFVEDIYNIGA